MTRKYGYTGRTFEVLHSFTGEGVMLHEIFSNRNIERHGVRVGDEGGWIQGDHNLSHFGDCWITENAHVYDNAHVSKRALATHAAELFGNAILTDRARAMNSSKIFGNGVVDRDITLFEDVMIIGKIDFIKNDFDELDGKNGLIAAGDFNIFLMRSEKHYPDTYSENFSYSEFIQIVPKDAAVDDGFGLAVFYEGNHICQSYLPKTDAFIDGKKIAILDADAYLAVSHFLNILDGKINRDDKNNLKEILNWHIKPLKVLGSG